MSNPTLPATQYALQLVGPGQLKLNPAKPVVPPGPHQVLARIECVSLCFSDLKLLKQFDQHPRKGAVARGISPQVLSEIPSYVPGTQPTVPGHEVTLRIVAVGPNVKHHKVGERCIAQTDYRDLPTAGSASAFGYNFEGALQEYVLMDERVIIDPAGERFLIPVSDQPAAAAVALVEPWACVEDSYVNVERQALKAGGRLLVVADDPARVSLDSLPCEPAGKPAEVLRQTPGQVGALADQSFDDILYFGASKAVLEVLNDKLAARGIINIVLGGKRIGAPVNVGVGRIHYGMTRWIGTTGSNPAEPYNTIPRTCELRNGDSFVVVGAGGPMGQMHVIRALCSGVPNLTVIGTDMDDARLASLQKKAEPFAKANGVALQMVNTVKTPLPGKYSYFALMAPVPALVSNSIRDSQPGCLINLFAGIPAPTKHELDLDTYIANRCFMLGTSGSTIDDMKIVLKKVTADRLNTNCSVDAVSGMAGATAGITAVENRTLAGKIVVYPMLHDMGLIPLVDLHQHYPTVAAKLVNGQWTKAAEDELLRVAAKA
ncbi:MAG TPA: alcohol dehydrogenase catalytic domain-containing protein [Verrucomicrobiota bacterium]|nr:alcohol dehydrogenase catalytic domain-containing protein [Verrucomicrobiota bacterium]HQL79576.1 alcohol dehydrogenase catalytic domain-containing protein [Verrucomicrobiota bacterium]